jgi:hypothetical protein
MVSVGICVDVWVGLEILTSFPACGASAPDALGVTEGGGGFGEPQAVRLRIVKMIVIIQKAFFFIGSLLGNSINLWKDSDNMVRCEQLLFYFNY